MQSNIFSFKHNDFYVPKMNTLLFLDTFFLLFSDLYTALIGVIPAIDKYIKRYFHFVFLLSCSTFV